MSEGKLVRDGIPDIIRASGGEPDVRYIAGKELLAALGAKLCEEAHEAAEAIGSPRELVEELADLQEVLNALMKAAGITDEEVASAAATKARERGGFDDGAWLKRQPDRA